MSRIALPDDLEVRLRQEAEANNLSLEEYTLGILAEAVHSSKGPPMLQDVVARIKAMPPSPHGLRPATGSLAEALRSAPPTGEFDAREWQANWSLVEDEIRALTLQNDIAEGLG